MRLSRFAVLASCAFVSACAGAPSAPEAPPATAPPVAAEAPRAPVPPAVNRSSVSADWTGEAGAPIQRVLVLVNAEDGGDPPVPEIARRLASAIAGRSSGASAQVYMLGVDDEAAYERAVADVNPQGVLAMQMDVESGTLRASLLMPSQREPVWEFTLRSTDPASLDPAMTSASVIGTMLADGVVAR